MTTTILPPLESVVRGLSIGGKSSTSVQNNGKNTTLLPSVEALFGARVPISRARSADDAHITRGRKASPALAHFAQDWGRLARSHPRFTDGAAILHKIDPRSRDTRTIEVRPQAPREDISGDYGRVRTELAHLSSSKCVCNLNDIPIHDVPEHLASSASQLVVGLPAPRADALGAIVPPIRLPGVVHGSALLLGAGAIARTATPLQTPVLTRQVVGRSLIVYWVPTAHALRVRAPAGSSFTSTVHRMMAGATLRAVVLGAGEWCILPTGSVYVTLALGDRPDQTQLSSELHATFSVQVKFAVHLLPTTTTTTTTTAPPATTSRIGEKRKADDDNDRESSWSGSQQSCDDGCVDCRRSCKRARTEEFESDRRSSHSYNNDYDDYEHSRTGRSVSPRHDRYDQQHQRDYAHLHQHPQHNTMFTHHRHSSPSAYGSHHHSNNLYL